MSQLRLEGLTVLVLEDEYVLADEAKAVLQHAGAEVLGPYVTAEEALAVSLWRRPDCAVLDLHLGSGLEFEPARALRRRGVPLVFFTGYDPAVIPADLRQERVVEKPVFMAAIADVVAEVCGRAAGRAALSAAGPPLRAEGLAPGL